MATLEENCAELTRLLGRDLIERASSSQPPIRQAIRSVLDFHKKKDYAQRDYVNTTLALLVKNLREIEAHDKSLLTQFRKVLRTANEDTYFGARFEISVAASLVRHKIPFLKSERPDFVLVKEFDGVSIECGTAHLAKPKPTAADLIYKIGTIVNRKSEQGYCNAGTSLFIDFTNINYHSLTNKAMLTNDQLKSYVAQALATSMFGGAVLFMYMLNLDSNRYQHKYHRVDGAHPSKLLLKFLNAAYPFGEDRTHSYGFMPRV
jgi:hypothetical protein